MDQDVVISVKNISKTFNLKSDRKDSLRGLFTNFFNQGKTNKFTALNNVSFQVSKGEFLGIVGRNGSGKSTLLKIIAEIYEPDKGGQLGIKGRVVPFLELGVGFNPELSGRENIYLNGTILGMTRKFLDQKYEEIVEFAELAEFIDAPVKNYSSGMVVRLAFSIAIQTDADIFVLDEILAVGDENFQRKCLGIIHDLKAQGKTILFVSHNSDAIIQLCNRAILIHNHKILVDGSPEKVINRYAKLNNPSRSKANAKATSTELVKNNNRWGNMDVEISNVQLYKGQALDTVYTENDDIEVSFDYKVNKSINNLAFGILVHTLSDIYVTGTNIDYDHSNPKQARPGSYSARFSVPAKYFLNGEYRLSVSAYDMDTISALDHHNKLYQFTVDNSKRDQGLVTLPFRWLKLR